MDATLSVPNFFFFTYYSFFFINLSSPLAPRVHLTVNSFSLPQCCSVLFSCLNSQTVRTGRTSLENVAVLIFNTSCLFPQLRKPDTHRILARRELAELARSADDSIPGPTHADDRRRWPTDVPARGAGRVQLCQRHIRHKRGGPGPVQWQERAANRPLRVCIYSFGFKIRYFFFFIKIRSYDYCCFERNICTTSDSN